MKWTYSVRNKMVASGALFVLCLLVLFSNYIDRDHTEKVKNAISTMYEDRLLVEDYILKMMNNVYQIKEVLNGSEVNEDNANTRISNLVSANNALSNAYIKTKLTESENIKFTELLKTLDDLESTPSPNLEYKLNNANKALVLLSELATIQLEESKLIMDKAEILYASGKASIQFASAVILVILLVLQALVFTSKTLNTSNRTSAAYLN